MMRDKRAFYIVLLSLFLSACGSPSHHEDLERKIKEIKARPGKPIEPVPDFKPTAHFQLPKNKGRRDPFYSLAEKNKNEKSDKNGETGAPDLKRPKQPLEAFPLDGLVMVGHLEHNGGMWALVKAPNSVIYQVKVGTYMGKHFGRVYSVTSRYIGLIETIRDGNRWKKKKIRIDLEKNRIDENQSS